MFNIDKLGLDLEGGGGGDRLFVGGCVGVGASTDMGFRRTGDIADDTDAPESGDGRDGEV